MWIVYVDDISMIIFLNKGGKIQFAPIILKFSKGSKGK